jgi:hypothetical protein
LKVQGPCNTFFQLIYERSRQLKSCLYIPRIGRLVGSIGNCLEFRMVQPSLCTGITNHEAQLRSARRLIGQNPDTATDHARWCDRPVPERTTSATEEICVVWNLQHTWFPLDILGLCKISWLETIHTPRWCPRKTWSPRGFVFSTSNYAPRHHLNYRVDNVGISFSMFICYKLL